MKDWRDATLYPDESALLAEWKGQGFFPNEQTLLSMWRWEFLRRRPDYQAAYAEQEERSQAYWDALFAAEGAIGPDQKRSDFSDSGARHLSRMAEDFGLELVRSPAWEFRITTPPLFAKSYGFGYSAALVQDRDDWGRHIVDARIQQEQMLIAFDLSLPLGEQLKRAQSHLEAVQSERNGAPIKPPRHHRRLWRKYLRVLDAREAGETFESIWENLELEGLSVEEFDARADRQNWAASGRQLWEQARDLMFKLTA